MDSISNARLVAVTNAIIRQHDEEIKAFLSGEVETNQWRPEKYAQAAIDALEAHDARPEPDPMGPPAFGGMA